MKYFVCSWGVSFLGRYGHRKSRNTVNMALFAQKGTRNFSMVDENILHVWYNMSNNEFPIYY